MEEFIEVLSGYFVAILMFIGVFTLGYLYIKWQIYYDNWKASHFHIEDYPDEKDGIIGKIEWKINLLKDFFNKMGF